MIITGILLATIVAVIAAGYFILDDSGTKDEYDTEPPSWIGENWTDDELEQTSLGQDIRGKTSLDMEE